MTIFHRLLSDRAAEHGPRPALLFGEETVSYAQLLARAEGTAARLIAQGVTAADNVALVMENSIAAVDAWLASSVIGCTEVPVNPQYRGELLLYLLSDSDASVVIADAAFAAEVAALAPRLPQLRLILVHGEFGMTGGIVAPFEHGPADLPPPPFADDAPEQIVLYTSGTTGPSKGVTHTQRSMLTLARYNAEMVGYGPGDRLLNFFPLYHQNARYTGVIPAIWAGASIRLQRKLSTSTFWQTCREDGITAFNYLGSVLRLILNVTPPDWTAADHTVRKAFGAGAPPALWRELQDRLGIRLVETYGLSEAPMATVNTSEGGRSATLGSAGRASDLFEIGVVDEGDNLLGPDETGEIVIRPRCPDAIMSGYRKKEAATVSAFRNLWFHSGDRGRLSASGELYFEERDKDAIRRRGENISAWEVESVLELHPDIAECAVYALPDSETDEAVAAALMLSRPDADLAAIVAFAADRLPSYAVPSLIRVMDDLHRTPTQKVQKARLREAGRDAHLAAAELARRATNIEETRP